MGAQFDELFLSINSKKIEEWASPNFSQRRLSRSGKLVSGHLSESSQPHSERSWLDFLALRGKS